VKRVVVGAHYGLRDWLAQRITAVLMAVYSVVLLGLTAALMSGGIGRTFAAGLFLLSYIFFASATWSLTTALIQNLVWRHTALGPHSFLSTLEPHRLLRVVLVNTLATVFTLGLFKPFAQVRLAKYVVGEMAMLVRGGLEGFAAGDQASVAAVGEEAAELFDIDLAF